MKQSLQEKKITFVTGRKSFGQEKKFWLLRNISLLLYSQINQPTRMKTLNNVIRLIIVTLILTPQLYAQNVGIGSTSFVPNSSAGLEINFSDKGLLIPRVALISTISNAPIGSGIATGLMVFNIDTSGTSPNQVLPGFYYWNGTKWITMVNNWHRFGNTGTTPGTDFIGTTDTQNLVFKVNNQIAGLIDQTNANNTFFGYQAGSNINNNGQSNAYFGYQSGSNTLTGIRNAAQGAYTLYLNDSGSYNSTIGTYSLYNNQGNENAANGYASLYSNTTGNENSANGAYALNNNSTGSNNVADGFEAAASNYSGSFNTSIGNYSLLSNQAGSHNVAIGNNALYHYLYSGNTAIGDGALAANTDNGSGADANNTAIGFEALNGTNIGMNNTGSGYHSLYSNNEGSNNTAHGMGALYGNITGYNNVGIGYYAGANDSTGSGNIFIGYQSGANEMGSNKLYISNSNTSNPLIGGDFSAGVVTLNNILKLTPGSVPSNPVAGMIYFDSTLNKLRCFDGVTWHNLW